MANSRQGEDVGITEYLSNHEGFGGIVKMRFQDFLVNEIDESDDVVHLTDMTCDSLHNDESDKPATEEPNVLSEEEKEKLANLVKDKEIDHVFVKAGDSKDERTKIHKAVRWLYPELESQTVDGENSGEKRIKVSRTQKGGGRSQNQRHRMPKRSLCKFVLYKQNIGTMEAMNFIAKKLHLHKANGFQYSGTKDKRAVTTQLVTAPVAAERLRGLNKLNSNVKVGNFSYCTKPLRLGALNGNHFSLVVRNVTGTEEKIASAFQSFSTKGFLNYFGLQRFGTTDVPTQNVGIAILKSDWQEVVNLILQPRKDGRDSSLNEGLEEYAKSKDLDAALDCLKYKSSIEGILLQGLKKFGEKQLLQAITMIPRNTRKMYVHAYQSYVWNKVASRKSKECGTKPIAGDLVFLKTYKNKTCAADHENDEPPSKKMKEEVSFDGELDEIKILAEDDLEHFALEDVVLPLPGHDIQYPENDAKSWYREIMAEDGMDMKSHMVHKVKDYSLPGAYRHFLIRPSRVEYDLVRYNDFTIPLLQDDLDRMNGIQKPAGIIDGEYLAARMQFSLPPSCYATVALRELMKTDISLSAQMKFNKEHGGPAPSTAAIILKAL